MRDCYGDWRKDRFAFDVLRATIDRFLDQHVRPEGEAVPKPTAQAEIIFDNFGHKTIVLAQTRLKVLDDEWM